MGLTSTHTHTRFFNRDQIVVIRIAFNDLRADWLERRDFVDDSTRCLGDARIAVLQNSIELCDQVVPL